MINARTWSTHRSQQERDQHLMSMACVCSLLSLPTAAALVHSFIHSFQHTIT